MYVYYYLRPSLVLSQNPNFYNKFLRSFPEKVLHCKFNSVLPTLRWFHFTIPLFVKRVVVFSYVLLDCVLSLHNNLWSYRTRVTSQPFLPYSTLPFNGLQWLNKVIDCALQWLLTVPGYPKYFRIRKSIHLFPNLSQL